MCRENVTESKLVLLAAGQADKLRDELFQQEIATLFQRTTFPKVEFRLLLY